MPDQPRGRDGPQSTPVGSASGAQPFNDISSHSNGSAPASGSSTTDALLQQLIDLQRSQAQDTAQRLVTSSKKERLERRQANRYSLAGSVAEALGVVCALLASSMLSSLIYPPEVVYDPMLWGEISSACYGPGKESCYGWQSLYGVSANVSFVLVMVALLMTVEVYMGRTSWLHRALVVFFTGVQASAITVIATSWLSFPSDLAHFSVAAMSTFILLTMLLLPSVLTWMYYQFPVIGGKAQMMEKLRTPKYAGTILANVDDGGVAVSSLHLVVYVLLDGDSLQSSNSFFNQLVRFSFDSWLRLLVLAEDEVGRAESNVLPPLLLVAFLGDARWAQIMLHFGSDPDCELVDDTGSYFPLYVAARAGHAKVVDVLLRYDADPCKVDATGQTALHAAAWGGSLPVTVALLRSGASALVVDSSGRSPLHWAAERGHNEVVDALLQAGADATAEDENGRNPLHLAAIAGNCQALRGLIRAKADVNARAMDGWTPLHAAACGGNAEAVATLVRCGAKVNVKSTTGGTPLHEAAERGHKSAAQVLVSAGAVVGEVDNAGSTPLHAAALGGSRDVVRLLLRAGADPSRADSGWTPLHAAAVGGCGEVVDALLKAGANAAGGDGWTPLLAAAWGGSLDVVDSLLTAGIDPKASDKYGRTSLHAAAWGGNDRVVHSLLRAGALVDAADVDGRTPLHQAAAGGHLRVIEVLLEGGADPNRLDKDGKSPLDEVSQGTHGRVEAVLREAAAGGGVRKGGGRGTTTTLPPGAARGVGGGAGGVGLVGRGGERCFAGGLMRSRGPGAGGRGREMSGRRCLGGGVSPAALMRRGDGRVGGHRVAPACDSKGSAVVGRVGVRQTGHPRPVLSLRLV